MTLADLKTAFKEARKVFREDKTNKKNKKKWKKAKQALADAKEAGGTPTKKRSAEEATEQTPRKKAKTEPSLDELKASAIKAKKAFKADKSNKENKAAWKKAKQELALAEAEANDTGAREEVTVDIDALKAAVKTARKTFKTDKTNKEARAAFKAAKAALAEADVGESETKEDNNVPDVLASLNKTAPEPVTNSVLSGLKKGGAGATPQKKEHNHDENPPNVRLFVGNLSFDIDDDCIKKFFADCGELTDIYWMMDRETERFKGFGFITFEDLASAAKAIEKNEQECMGRPMRVSYAKPRENRAKGSGGGGGKGGSRPLSEKPQGCTTIFCGNLSFDVDDGKMGEFLSECGGIRAIRWLKDRESGDFKGCGFVEFDNPETAIDIAIKLNGKEFMGRTVRIDYAKPRAPREA